MAYKPKIALCMIVKATDDEASLLDSCLDSVKDHVDGIFLNLNAKSKKISPKVRKVAKKYTKDIIETEWTGNFVKSRTDNFNQVPEDYDWIMWLDADDTVENPEKIREVCAIISPQVDGLYVKYDYAHDEYGNVTVTHYTSRIVRNNGSFAWKSSFQDGEVTVHETLNEIRKVGKVMNNEFKVVHHADEDRRDASLARNIKLLEGMLKNSADSVDPRILYYLATHYIDAGLQGRAKTLFEQYLQLSGWAEERSQAWVYLGDIYKLMRDKEKARGCYMHALAENPSDPSPYVELGQLESEDMLWEKAIEWLETATKKKVDETTIVLRPMEANYRAYKLLAEAYTNSGSKGYEKASKCLTKAIELRPFDPELQKARELLDELTKTRDLNKSALSLVNELKNSREYEKIIPLVDNLPVKMQESPLIHSVRNYYRKPVKWEKKSIAIVCGSSSLGDWGPWSLQSGISGSEEAVIQLSQQLKELGWDVSVFATPGTKAGTHDGVHWRHHWEFSGRDTFDVLIGWRSPAMYDQAFRARKRYLWLHDVIDKEELTKARLANLDKVIFVSEYHRSLYPDVPDPKCFISGNGIDPAQFEEMDGKFKRNPHRVIYMSAHERGQELLQKVWPNVKKAVPDAVCDVYYGWDGFNEVNKDNPERMAWKERLLQDMKRLKDFNDNGRIGHKQIAEEIFKSGIWAYPSTFPEVYCHPAGTKVMTEFGEKNIEELLLTDKVLTHRGVLRPIYQTMRRNAEKLLRLSIRSGDDLLLTPNHPVYTKRNGKYEWVEAGQLTTEDVLLTPAKLLHTDYGWTDCAKFIIEDEYSYRANNLPTTQHVLPDELEITPEFAKFMGYFAGDGNANERGKVSVLVANKHPEHEKTVLDGFKHIGLRPDIVEKRGCKEYRVYNYQLARAFRKFFYDGKTKKLPLWLTSYPEALDGLLEADGHCKNGYNFGFTNTSDRLIGWVKVALAQRGYSGKAQKRVHKAGKVSWTISWTQERKLPQYHKVGSFIEKKIKNIEEIEYYDWVYNIEVQEDHSYISNGSVVHNCITAIKAQAGGAYPVTSDYAALKEKVKYGVKIPTPNYDKHTHAGIWNESDLDKYEKALIDSLKNPDKANKIRTEMMRWARDTHSWANTAKGWNNEFTS